uniref:Death domain-containing protein n=1 Tax=Amphimedon queenslandica TaxID=400682 RepID=A0A1X7URN7_AMPQE
MATSQPCLGSAIGVNDLIDVLDLLKRCGFPETRWYELGLRLGLLKKTLDVVEKNHPHDVSRCMTECLSQWLGRADNVADSRGGANLDSLSDALQSMNETAVAEKLKHDVLINIFNNRHTVLSQSLCDSVSIAWLLYAEHMLAQEAVSRVVSASPSISNQREALLTAVKEAVQTDPNSLHTFANILCTMSTNVSLGQDILDDISKYFPTPEVGLVPETIDMVPEAIASNSCSQTLSPQVNKLHVPVSESLLENFTSMRMSYGSMFYNVGKIIKQKRCSLKELKEFLSCCGTVLGEKVKKCRDISSVLHLIQNECSLTNIALLHSVVEEMKVSEAEEHIKTYRTELEEFCKSLSVSLCLKERFSSISHLQCETVILVFDWKPEKHVLKDIKELLAKASGKLLRIQYIEPSESICVTCSFPFFDVGFTVLRMIENIHILMGQGLKKLSIGNLTLWRRQDVRQKELKKEDQDLLQHTEVISYIILEEAKCKLRNAISSKKKEEPLNEDLIVLMSLSQKMKKENKELRDKLSKMKFDRDHLRSLSSCTGSAASKVRRGMEFEIEDCKVQLQAMTSPDYQPLVDDKRIIEILQEKITLMNMELITKRECNEKIKIDIKDLKVAEGKRQREKEQIIQAEMRKFSLYCNHPVTGKLMESTLEVHKNELLPQVLDKAYKLMNMAPHVPIERCRLVKYDHNNEVMDQSFDLDEFQHQTIGQIAGYHYPLSLFLETRDKFEICKKYNHGGINLEISVVDLSTGEVGPAKQMRSEKSWTVGELKQHIGEVFNINSSCMRLAREEEDYFGATLVHELRDAGIILNEIIKLYRTNHKIYMYVLSDHEDYQKEFKDSLMYKYVDFYVNSMLLNITMPPQPAKATSFTTDTTGRGIIMKISANEEIKGKERKIKLQVHRRVTIAELKEDLIPLIGVPPTGFRVCINDFIIRYNLQYEIKLNDKLMNIKPGSELILRLGRALRKGELRITIYLLQVSNTEFHDGVHCCYGYTTQGINSALELDKMRLRYKNGVSPGIIYLDHQLIDTSREIYVELLKEPEYDTHVQVYVIRWHPSQCSFDSVGEIILDKYYDPEHVIERLSELSGIPVEHIYYTKSESFPVEVSCPDIEYELKWISVTSDRSFLSYDDGRVIYYKDNREKMKELTDKERSEMQEAEEARLERIRSQIRLLIKLI